MKVKKHILAIGSFSIVVVAMATLSIITPRHKAVASGGYLFISSATVSDNTLSVSGEAVGGFSDHDCSPFLGGYSSPDTASSAGWILNTGADGGYDLILEASGD